jgi:pimeloyl-ACP methyl ester carboxylesterase
MKIEKYSTKSIGIDIPTIKISTSFYSPNAIIIHGYGGNKEEQLGLSFRIATLGFNTFTIDLRGHGENALPLSNAIVDR